MATPTGATSAERNGFWQDLCNYVFGFGGRWPI